ncbi:MAG: FtsQ-type POTRA domain-containing protein [Sphingomonas sp.]|uniref:cell division protein FtsQ/DivIB n=1 Tax=Sphingomonas sp. TaxID=28214 RepID=UPI0025EC4E21|nr:cell division protein FtsQ/DivIB [Sphingomonas sp.]MBY0285223.1 FtsQ-type POTRA domain-containing protein [Sphingomonas sp.]
MTKTIRRGAAPQRRPVQPGRRVPAVRKQSTIDRLLLMLPVSERTLQRIATWTIMGMIFAGAVGLSTLFGVPQAAALALAEGVGAAGFRVKQIETTGARRLSEAAIAAVVLDQKSRAMPLVDLNEVRARLLRYGWVADAQVSRRLPDKLVIHIIERQPVAVWQDHGQLQLIDAKGVTLEQVAPEKMPDLPLLIGEGANEQLAAYRALLDATPGLRPLVRAATWVGNRRWDLMFTTGETLALPEEMPQRALVKFADIDSNRQLLGRGWVRFDMRDPTRFVVRKPGLAGPRSITDTSAAEHFEPSRDKEA